jgi:hypothetical protein
MKFVGVAREDEVSCTSSAGISNSIQKWFSTLCGVMPCSAHTAISFEVALYRDIRPSAGPGLPNSNQPVALHLIDQPSKPSRSHIGELAVGDRLTLEGFRQGPPDPTNAPLVTVSRKKFGEKSGYRQLEPGSCPHLLVGFGAFALAGSARKLVGQEMHKRFGLVALTSTAEIGKGSVSQLAGDVGRRKTTLMVSFG